MERRRRRGLVGRILFAASLMLLGSVTSVPALPVIDLAKLGDTSGQASASNTVASDEVSVGSISISVSDAGFHVGDQRTVQVETIVSFGDGESDDDENGGLTMTATLAGKSYTVEVFAVLDLTGDGRRKYTTSFDIEGKEVGTATIEVEVRVTGWEIGLLWDDFEIVKDTESEDVTVLFPLDPPVLLPATPVVFDHPAGADHKIRMGNYSTQRAWVYDARVNKSTRIITDIPPGAELSTATHEDIVEGRVEHEAPGHPGTTVPVPFTWEVPTVEILVLGGTWTHSYNVVAVRDSCRDPNPSNGGSGDVPPEEGSEYEREFSTGQRTIDARTLSRHVPEGSLAGIPILLHDTVDGVDHELLTDTNGTVSWNNLLLGPTLELHLNTGGADPAFETIVFPQLPLPAWEAQDDSTLMFLERRAGPITGSVGATDGGPLRVEVLVRADATDTLRTLQTVLTGNLALRGHGVLEFQGPAPELVLVAHPGPNRTLVTPDTMLVSLGDVSDSLDVGAFLWDVLPHSLEPLIAFSGNFVDAVTGLPVAGMTIETESLDNGLIDAEAITGPEGSFAMQVPSGLHLVRAYAAAVGYEEREDQLVDFGANGLAELVAVDRPLTPLATSSTPERRHGSRILSLGPNPTTQRTTIRLDLEHGMRVRVIIYDVRGRPVYEDQRQLAAGTTTLEWRGVDQRGRELAAGAYFVRVLGAGIDEVTKVLLVR